MRIEVLPGNAVRIDHACEFCGERVRWDGRIHTSGSGTQSLRGVCGCERELWVCPLGPPYVQPS
jgi:hypothetical protein